MKIGEIAKAAGVSKDTVRHYVDSGLLSPGRDPDNGYQLFGTKDLNRLHFIRQARQLGFRLDDVKQIFEDARSDQSPCPRVREIMVERIRDTRRQIAELQALCETMESAVRRWEAMPDGTPTGDSICRLIETPLAKSQKDASKSPELELQS